MTTNPFINPTLLFRDMARPTCSVCGTSFGYHIKPYGKWICKICFVGKFGTDADWNYFKSQQVKEQKQYQKNKESTFRSDLW